MKNKQIISNKIKISLIVFILFVVIFTFLYKYLANYSWQNALYTSLSEQTFAGACVEETIAQRIAIIQLITAYIFVGIILFHVI
jgi:hypothetical protein